MPDFIEGGVHKLQELGFRVVAHDQCYSRDRGSAGTTVEKIAALHDFFVDPMIDAVFSVRGGARAIHMLDGLDYNLITNHPKIFAGLSDVTVLSSAIYARSNLVGFHATMAADIGRNATATTIDKTFEFLTGKWQVPLWDQSPTPLRQGVGEGRLFGGNLSMLNALLAAGDRYVPDFDDMILVIEDIGEEFRAIDRMIGSLRLRGVFESIKGLVVGYMTGMKSTDYIPFDRTIEEIVLEHTAQMRGPIVMNAPIGHEHPNIPFPIGVRARLTAETNGKAQLQLLESPFSDG
jgi:muramoyltetrapeptide carboxypeptidase